MLPDTLLNKHFIVCGRLLAAYGMVVEGCSADVRLKVILTGGHLQFAVTATRDLPKGVYLYELAGIMAADTEALHSRLSEITPHRSQGKGTVPKILFGPARFVNHDCKNANVEVGLTVSLHTLILISHSLVCGSCGNIFIYHENEAVYQGRRRALFGLWPGVLHRPICGMSLLILQSDRYLKFPQKWQSIWNAKLVNGKVQISRWRPRSQAREEPCKQKAQKGTGLSL